MGDDLEAGKYILLAVDEPNESELATINLFLSRCRHQDYEHLLKAFPACARIENRDEYPEHLKNHLIDIGAPSVLDANKATATVESNAMYDRLFLFGCSILVFLTITCILTGAYTILSWFWGTR